MWTFKVKSGKCDAIAVDCIDNGGNGNERLLNLFASAEQCSDFCIGNQNVFQTKMYYHDWFCR